MAQRSGPATDDADSISIRSALPGQRAEGQSFALLEHLQLAVARAGARAGAPIAATPLWSTQAALFALAIRREPSLGPPARAWNRLTARFASNGSRVFPDHQAWRADDAGLAEVLALTDPLTDGELSMLIGRTLDYGRTRDWSIEDSGPDARRNLVTAKSQGIFYTPAFVATHLVAQCLEGRTGDSCPTVCDPSVGGGAFLLAAAHALLRTHPPRRVRDALFGADTDPLAVEVTAILIEAACGLWQPGHPPQGLTTNIVIGDAFGGPVNEPGPALPGAISWHDAFPTVFDRPNPGFDAVLVNPPFGRHKIDSDWLIAREMHLDHLLLADLRAQGRQRATDLRSAGFFPLSSVGVLDKSRIGLERSMQLTARGGSLGALVPSTIAADTHSFLLRQELLTQWELREINEFPETARLFRDVSQSVSTLHAVKGTPTTSVRVRSNVRLEADLDAAPDAEWPLDLLRQISPKFAIPLRTVDSTGVLATMHRHPALRDLPDIVNARGEVDVSAFGPGLTDDPAMTPLIRGDQIDCFRADLPSDKLSFVETSLFESRLAQSPKYDHFLQARIVGRQCSYLYRPKRLSFAAVHARRAVANSCNYVIATDETVQLYLLGLLNSSLLNWRFKVTNSNNHVANSELADLPIPDPHAAPSTLVAAISQRAAHLTADADADEALAAELDDLVFELYGLGAAQAAAVREAEAAR